MDQTLSFRAPWGKSLIIMSTVASLILLGMPLFTITTSFTGNAPPIATVAIPLIIFFGALLFTIRGYELSNNRLYIKRLFWRNAIDLSTLRDIQIKENAMTGSIRTLGNGGLFSFSGKFKNSELGSYRAFVTDPKNTIVLRFSNRTIVVTPDRPDEFVTAVKSSMN